MAAGNGDQPVTSGQKMEIDMSEFMDVIYTYKCKFCSFTTTDSPTFTNHVLNEHMQERLQKVAKTSEETQTSNSTETETGISEGNIKPGTSLLILGSKIIPKTATTSTSMSLEEVGGEDAPLVIEHQSNDSQVTDQVHSLTAETDTVQSPDETVSEQATGPNSELRELFLCGQCNLGFTSIEECKGHMMQDHNVSMTTADVLPSPSETESPAEVAMPANMVSVGTQSHAHKRPGRKRKSEIAAEQNAQEETENKDNEELDFKMEAPVSLFNMRDSDDPGKRKVNPPKALMEDYYLGSRKHKKRREPREPYSIKCKIQRCLAKFKTEEAKQVHLDCHLDIKDQAPGKMFRCLKCECTFINWKLTAKHMWKEHAIDADLHKCYMCEFRTDTLQKLETHEQVHSDQKPFMCSACGKGFRQAAQLSNHEVIHLKGKVENKNSAEKWYHTKQCGICNRTFANVKSMRNHIETVHEKVKPYTCSYCGHTTARKAMLLLHLRTHTGEKPYKCDLCTYITSDHNTLRRHRMRHTGQKPYKCPYCPYSCIQAISLKTHMKNKHPGCEGIFSCDTCQYQTVNKPNWEQHLEDHRNGLISDPLLDKSSDAQKTTTAGTRKLLPRSNKGAFVSGSKDEIAKDSRPVLYVTGADQGAISSTMTIPSTATSVNLQSMLSLATTSGTQVLYYDPVTQQLSAGMPDGNPHSQTVVMADAATKDLIAANTSASDTSMNSEAIHVQHLQDVSYTVSQSEGGEVLFAVEEGSSSQSTSLIPEGSIIYTQEGEHGQQTLTIQQNTATQMSEELHVPSEQTEIPAVSESTGLHHILTAIQNMSEESEVPMSANTTSQTEEMEVVQEGVDDSAPPQQYIIEINQ